MLKSAVAKGIMGIGSDLGFFDVLLVLTGFMALEAKFNTDLYLDLIL